MKHPKAEAIFADGEAFHAVRIEEWGDALKDIDSNILRFQFDQAAEGLCESPIEQILLASLIWQATFIFGGGLSLWLDGPKPKAATVIRPQHHIGLHRIDFAVFINSWNDREIRLAIECDGHEFHEKTKEQAARDKSRDRVLQTEGWRVLRFTGSEIWRRPMECAEQVFELCSNEVAEQYRPRPKGV